jgi:trans-2,3-dihydro-3-hydroxyanthranilate isomerase
MRRVGRGSSQVSRIIPFHLVDVFAVEPLTGNSLAVVDGVDDLPVELMQRIAREFNQSETTFVMPPSLADADWRLRSFTPKGVEVFGAGGHNTLGAWWVLAATGRLQLRGAQTPFRQQIGDKVHPLVVWQTGKKLDKVVMRQEAPTAGKRLDDELGELAEALCIARSDIATDTLPCQVVSTGADHLLVPIRDRGAVDRIVPDGRRLFELLRGVDAEGCYVFSLDPPHPEAAAYARFFNPTVGIAEDPATGSAAGPLGAHMVMHGLAEFGPVRIEQGTALGRTSLIDVEVSPESVSISGRGVVVAKGEFSI